jgi:hypothetical protein
MSWNIPETKQPVSDLLDPAFTQELLLSCYIEEQDKWNKAMIQLEQDLIAKEKHLRELRKQKDKWWEGLALKLFGRVPDLQKESKAVEEEVRFLSDKYAVLITQMPKIDAYEFAMYGSKMFKVK